MKRLAIFIDGSENDSDSLLSAVAFARITGAHLDVIYPHFGRSSVAVLAEDAVSLPDVDIGTVDEDIARRAFNEVCGELDNARWIAVEGEMDHAIRALSLSYDLTIVERISEEQGPLAKALNTALFETGSPVLVTPPTAPTVIGNVVALIWTGTAQSARAMRSALPVLKASKQVYLLSNTDNPYANPGRAIEYLGYHDIRPTEMSFDGSGMTARGRGRAIIAAALSISADLIIMGAFGDNHFDALLGLGRTTRKLATASPMPLLLQN